MERKIYKPCDSFIETAALFPGHPLFVRGATSSQCQCLLNEIFLVSFGNEIVPVFAFARKQSSSELRQLADLRSTVTTHQKQEKKNTSNSYYVRACCAVSLLCPRQDKTISRHHAAVSDERDKYVALTPEDSLGFVTGVM